MFKYYGQPKWYKTWCRIGWHHYSLGLNLSVSAPRLRGMDDRWCFIATVGLGPIWAGIRVERPQKLWLPKPEGSDD